MFKNLVYKWHLHSKVRLRYTLKEYTTDWKEYQDIHYNEGMLGSRWPVEKVDLQVFFSDRHLKYDKVSSLGSKTPDDHQKYWIYPKLIKEHFTIIVCISEILLISSNFAASYLANHSSHRQNVYTFWKRENKPKKSSKSNGPPKNDTSYWFWCFKNAYFVPVMQNTPF